MSDSRRAFLKRGALAALGVGAGTNPSLALGPRPRVAIVGGGLAGISCAWLLDGVADAVLFESRARLGGHADTILVDVGTQRVPVDVGAQFVAPGPQPTYWKLLEVVGLRQPDQPDRDATIEAEMSITVSAAGRLQPLFISPAGGRSWPIVARWNRDALFAFFAFGLAAREFTRDGSWLVRLDDWLRALPVAEEQREGLLLPLLSALVGCSTDQARRLSARGALLFVGRALPENWLDPFVYANSLIGLGGNAEVLAALSGSLTVHLGAAVVDVARLSDGRFAIRNAAGAVETADLVVFATPPYVTRALLPERLALAKAAWVLGTFEYFPTEVSIHRDPAYMPESLFYWSAYNARIERGRCEASVWYGPLRQRAEGQAPLILFKSWATARERDPEDEVHRRRFLHPLVTPEFIAAQSVLEACQGRERIWFAGSYTREVDSQESALVSAIRVVQELAPDAPNLVALRS